MSEPLAIAIASFELTLLIAGLVLFWRFVVSPAARRQRGPSALVAWEVPIADFFSFALLVLGGMVVGSILGVAGVKLLGLRETPATMFAGAAMQLGMLVGAAAGLGSFRGGAAAPPHASAGIFASGAITFLISLPLLTITSLVWRVLLKAVGLPEQRQDLVGMFARADSLALLTLMILLAAVIAPIAEELVFRAGLFRYFRTRMTRALALLLPAILFALLHANFASFAPLVLLAIIFSLAYERTGRIGTSIVAHALFNLNTIMLILSGVADLA
jgi:membrane protease YdiL (CAAX protease family)